MDEKRIIETLEMIIQDVADDAKNFDGKPLTGSTVAEYFGNQGAAITALANILISLVETRLTPLDGVDSAASKQFPTPEVLSTLQGESTPAHRK